MLPPKTERLVDAVPGWFECNQCGSNHLEESDRRPLTLCPECVCKVLWATGADPRRRFERLAAFCRDQGLADTRTAYEQAIAALARAGAQPPEPEGR